MKRQSTLEWETDYNVADIWKVVTNNRDYAWRNDIQRIEIVNEAEFIEYYKGGGETHFAISKCITEEIYEFKMTNKLFTGDWTGKFVTIHPNQTKLIFTESLEIKNPVVYILSFFMMDLKKIQNQYRVDLEKRLVSEKCK